MPSFFKRLGLLLKGGIPATSVYENQRAVLVHKYERYRQLQNMPVMTTYRDLAAQWATPARQSGLSGHERKQMKGELEKMRRLPEVVEFFNLQKATHNFGEITKWELAFEDSFETTILDTQNWKTSPIQSVMLPAVDYSPADGDFIYAGDKNINMPGGAVQLLTKQETAQGLAFSQEFGFVNVERSHSTAIINTGVSFKQQYGKIEVKFKFTSSSKHVYHSVWLSSGARLPHINLVNIGRKIEFGIYTQTNGIVVKKVGSWPRATLRQNTSYILTVEWSAKQIDWYINGVRLFSTANLVNEPMFLGASSGVVGHSTTQTPSVLELGWVKVYRGNDAKNN